METSFQSNYETLKATHYKAASLAGGILCPPHPLYGGNRNDTRIVKVAKEHEKHTKKRKMISSQHHEP